MGSSTSKPSKKKTPQAELKFEELGNHPLASTISERFIDCVFYESIDGEQYIICICSIETSCIYRYNIHKKQWSKFVEYPPEMESARNIGVSCALDTSQRKLYIFPYWNRWYHVLHIETKQWKHYDGSMFYDTNSAPKALCIQSKIHIISARTKFYHFIHDSVTNTIIPSGKIKYKIMTKLLTSSSYDTKIKFRICYADATKQIIMFHEGYKNIWFCDIKDLEWKKSKIKLPYKDWEFIATIVYDFIIILIYYTRKEVWCLDLQQSQWFKSNKVVSPIKGRSRSAVCVLRDDNVMHVMNLWTPSHISFNVKDIIPSDLSDKINLRYVMVISGFIRAEIHKSFELSVDVIELIAKFCFN